MSLTTIRPATTGDRDIVAELLARAFHEPVTRWLVPDPDRHPKVITDLFTRAVTDALTAGTIDVLTDDTGHPLAAALWFDHTGPGPASATSGQDPAAGSGWHLAFSGHAGDARRWGTLDALMSENHLRGPHHYLFAIGVEPAIQRCGLGSRLLTHRHQRLGDYPAYLEATSENSRHLYRRHGYTDLGRIQPPNGPPLWRMWLPSADLSATTHPRHSQTAQAY